MDICMDCAGAMLCIRQKDYELKIENQNQNKNKPAGVEQGVVQVENQQQLARCQQPPQVGRSQPRRLLAADPEVGLDVPAPGAQSGCVSGAIWP